MALSKFAQRYEAGDAWLADCSAHPDLVRAAWAKETLAPIASGERWLVAEARLATAYLLIGRIRDEHRGPILADPEADKLWWLIPPDAAEELADVRQLAVQPAGWTLLCPPTRWLVGGRMWITYPDGSGQLTDPAVLAAAFGPGGYRLHTEATP
ncbi:hypothetical protein [Streptomyces sp. cf386]|uniref:hypothetical protein n=1 Tax=Streptomyces sp. cf386 TaxID=1761904 RepID=UPI000B8479E8|nr:hypothetical protein [Streptomyces sp. cf386]